MTRFLWGLAASSAGMTVVTLLLHAAMPRMLARYRASTVYLAFWLVCLGFAVPLRPALGPPVAGAGLQVVAADPAAFAGVAANAAERGVWALPGQADLFAALILAVWAAGALASVALAAYRHLRFMRMVRRWSAPAEAEAILRAYAWACADMRVASAPALRICPAVRVPMLTGLFHPLILLPGEDMPAQEARWMLRHELAHYRRRDVWGKALALAAGAVHWFNPAVRLAARDMGIACEIACDEAAMREASPERRLRYSELLVYTARYGEAALLPLTSHFGAGKEGVRRRIAAVMGAGGQRMGAWLLALSAALSLGVGVLIPNEGASRAQDMHTVFSSANAGETRYEGEVVTDASANMTAVEDTAQDLADTVWSENDPQVQETRIVHASSEGA